MNTPSLALLLALGLSSQALAGGIPSEKHRGVTKQGEDCYVQVDSENKEISFGWREKQGPWEAARFSYKAPTRKSAKGIQFDGSDGMSAYRVRIKLDKKGSMKSADLAIDAMMVLGYDATCLKLKAE
jgi:hypothetical protein